MNYFRIFFITDLIFFENKIYNCYFQMIKQKLKIPYQPKIVKSIILGITRILAGDELVLVEYKTQLSNYVSPGTYESKVMIASEMESKLLLVPEIVEFLDTCYGKNWGIRPCPIFTTKPHTIISKNIGMNLGIDNEQIFEFALGSTMNAKSQELMFKRKPNHNLTDYNHLVYYNRYDGVICLEETTHTIQYDACKYLLLYAPLLVISKRDDMLRKTANICFETSEYLALLDLKLPGHLLTIREYDMFAAQTNQLGLLTHHGHPNPLFITHEKDINPSNLQSLSPLRTLRYTSVSLTPSKSSESILSGTFFKLFPSFLFRRNWFTALGNQREHGAWIGALCTWIEKSSLNVNMRDFLVMTWFPSEYQQLYSKHALDSGISQQSINRHQHKFVIVNMKLLEYKLLDTSHIESNIVDDDFLPSSEWDKLLKRRVKLSTRSLEVDTSKATVIPNSVPEKLKTSKKNTGKKVHKIKTKTEEKNNGEIINRDFHILPPDLEQETREEVSKSKEWLKRIETNIGSISSSSSITSLDLSKELDHMKISFVALHTFKQLILSELNT
jgi:hypothetical protein